VFAPTDLPSLQLWLDASNTSTITSSGSPATVSQWNDKSGNARNFTQAVGASQPTTGVDTQNGLNVITFDGSNDHLLLGSSGLGRNVTGITSYIVISWSANPTTNRRVLQFDTEDVGGLVRHLIDAGNISQRIRFGGRRLDAGSFTGSTDGSTVISSSDVFVVTTTADYTAGTLVGRINGTAEGTAGAFTTGATSDTNSLAAAVGAATNGTSLFHQGDIAEIIVYHAAHTTDQRALVQTYLNDKWAVF
jgi:hypothetical protein